MQKHINIISLTAFVLTLCVPLTAFSAGVIDADDSVAGLGLDIHGYGLPANTNVTVVVIPPRGEEIVMQASTDSRGETMATLRGTETETAGRYDVIVEENGRRLPVAGSFTVYPDEFDVRASLLTSDKQSISPDGRDTASVVVSARDRYGNPLSGRPTVLISSRGDDRIDALDRETDGYGDQHFEVSTTEPGTVSLRAIDILTGEALDATLTLSAGGMGGNRYTGSVSDIYNSYSPTAYDPRPYDPYSYTAQVTNTQGGGTIVDRFEITAPSEMVAGVEAQQITIRAVDRDGRTVDRYTNTVRFSSSDPLAVLPGLSRTYTFEGRDAGQRTFSLALKFQSAGEQTFRVEDTNDPSISGEKIISVRGGTTPTTSRPITITSHKDGDTISADRIILEGEGPAFVNLLVLGGIDDQRGDTDRQGRFSIPVSLNPSQRDFTIRVRDDSGRYDSGNLHLILDKTLPTIDSVTFAPERPQQGSQTVVAVQSEPNMKSVTMQLQNLTDKTTLDVTLRPVGSSSGAYQAIFTAPAAGAYQPLITVTDTAGNKAEVRSMLTITGPGLPTVTNLIGTPRPSGVELQWDAVPEAEQYRIYIGDSPTNFLYSLDTGKPLTKAMVGGLDATKTYFMTVTALRDTMESAEKSNIITIRPAGLTLSATPGNGSLLLQWNGLPAELRLLNYQLEFGTDPAVMQGKILLNPEMMTHTMRDLINGVTYHLRLTPIAITGDKLTDMAALATGTPSATGALHPSATTEPPFHGGAPSTPVTGIPSWLWWAAGTLAILAGYLRWQQMKNQRMTEAFLVAMQSQYDQRG